jgi:hypothetical protein
MFLVFTLWLTLSAEAGLLDSCWHWFARSESKQASLPVAELKEWRESFSRGGTHPYLYANRMDEEELLFWHAYEALPANIRRRLESLPADSKAAYRVSHEWFGAERDGESFLDQILKRLDRNKAPTEDAGYFLKLQLAKYRERVAKEPALKADLAERFALANRHSRANAAWVREAGVTSIPILERAGKKYLQLGEEQFEAVLQDGAWVVLVPKERVAHPAWNPVSREKLMTMAGAGVPTPKSYQTTLGHDGKFYLLDGNHRFELESRKMVPVRIPDPPATTNYRAMFDLVDLRQPEESKLLDFHEGRIPLRALLDKAEDMRHFLLLKP